jgi:hypothetical protein
MNFERRNMGLLISELKFVLDYVRKRKNKLKPAAVEAELKSRNWSIISPIPVEDNHFIVIKVRTPELNREYFQEFCRSRKLILGKRARVEIIVRIVNK